MQQPVQLYRRALREEVQTVNRHLEKARPILEICSALDPRFKHLPWASSQEVERIRREVFQQALELSRLTNEAANQGAEEDLEAVRPLRVANHSARRPVLRQHGRDAG